MKTIKMILILFVLTGTTLFAQADDEKKAIKEAVLNYLEGWYDGDVDRMTKALHPELAKRALATLPQTGTSFINTATSLNRMGNGKLLMCYGIGFHTKRKKMSNLFPG